MLFIEDSEIWQGAVPAVSTGCPRAQMVACGRGAVEPAVIHGLHGRGPVCVSFAVAPLKGYVHPPITPIQSLMRKSILYILVFAP